MDNVLSFGWAVDTYHAQLGARLEAYVATKAALTTLRASIRHSATSSMRRTSPEITEMISNALKDSVYNDLIGRWNHEAKCIRDVCNSIDHFSDTELSSYGRQIDNDSEHLCDDHPVFRVQGLSRHRETFNHHIAKITKPGLFHRCREVNITPDMLADCPSR